MFGNNFYVDPSRCIGCRSCVQACTECDSHRGKSMIHVDELDRANGIETTPMVCMHCDEPTCALVCPADAIKKGEDGVVRSALKPRCIACSNCVLACPFGVPMVFPEMELMMKCDMCYDRTSVGLRPMCATVCPSGALTYRPPEEIAGRREEPRSEFHFGHQIVTTQVRIMLPPNTPALTFDVSDYMWKGTDSPSL